MAQATMTMALLLHKLSPPVALKTQMRRPRLEDEIRGATDACLVLVHAPAGFGKTTLLAQHYRTLGEQGTNVAWLSLDRGDNDERRFAGHLAAALVSAGPRVSGSPAVEDMDGLGLVHLVAARREPFHLFLDDCDQVTSSNAMDMLQRVVHFMPPGSRVYLGSRCIPEIGIPRLRAQRRLLEVDSHALRFSLDETSHLMHDRLDLPLGSKDVSRLHGCTEGWITALQLGALSLEKHQDIDRVISTLSNAGANLSDYFAATVLGDEVPEMRGFLLRTGILATLSWSLCDALTGRDDSRAILAQLEKRNLFLVPLGSDRRWYRYHSLFSSFLRQQLDFELPGERERLHRLAADWFERNGRPVPAIDHALLAGAYDRAVSLLNRHAQAFLHEGRVRLLSRWADELQLVHSVLPPEQALIYAWAYALARRYQAAGQLLSGILERDARMRDQVMVLQSFILTMTDKAEQPRMLNRASAVAGLDPFARALEANSLAYVLTGLGDYQGVRKVVAAAREAIVNQPDHYSLSLLECNECISEALQGRILAATARLDNLYARAGTSGRASIGVAFAWMRYEAGDLSETERLLSECLPFIADSGTPDSLITGHLTAVRTACARNDIDAVMQRLSEMEYAGHRNRLARMNATAALERSRVALLQRDLDSAAWFLEQASDREMWRRFDRFQMYANDVDTLGIARARLHLEKGEPGKALRLLEQELLVAGRTLRRRRILRLNILRARTLYELGQQQDGLALLLRAVHEGAAERALRAFADEGAAVAALLRALRQDDMPITTLQFIDGVIDAVQKSVGADEPGQNSLLIPAPAVSATPSTPREALTSRELTVLRLLAQGHPNRILAEKLFVSEATVKSHLQRINAKLNARNRTDAVSIARDAGML